MNEAITIDGDTAVTPTTFDFSSAQLMVIPSLRNHSFYRDAAGSICLTVVGRHEDRKVAIRDLAIEWLDQMPGAHFIRVINEVGMTDRIAPRYQIQMDAPLRLARIPEDAQDLT